MTVTELGRKMPQNLILAMCTRPMILAVPTPLATPAKRVSTSRIRLHLVAHALLMMVLFTRNNTYWVRCLGIRLVEVLTLPVPV